MVMLKIFIKLLPYIWPFLREMVLGKKSIIAALRDNKKKVFFITLVITSFGLNFLTIPRLLTVSVEYVALDKRYKELQANFNRLNSSAKHPGTNGSEQQAQVKTEAKPIPNLTVEPEVIIPKKQKKPSTHSTSSNSAAEHFEEILRREEKESFNLPTDRG